MFERTVNDLLDADWHVEITEQLTANPMGIAFAVEPALMGQYCAERGEPCEPLRYGYTRLADVEAFCIAWHDTVALWATIVQRKNDELDAERAWLDGELQMLIDGREDEDFWRWGC